LRQPHGWHTAYARQNLLLLCPKTAPCPEAATQATTTAAADQATNHGKAFPKPLRAGFCLAAILTRSERGANEVQMRSEIRFWEIDLSLLTNSLVATRFRILFPTVTQELSTVEQKRKPSQAAAAGKSKESKGTQAWQTSIQLPRLSSFGV